MGTPSLEKVCGIKGGARRGTVNIIPKRILEIWRLPSAFCNVTKVTQIEACQ